MSECAVHPSQETIEARKERFRAGATALGRELRVAAHRVEHITPAVGSLDMTVRELLAELDKAKERGSSGMFRIGTLPECACEPKR